MSVNRLNFSELCWYRNIKKKKIFNVLLQALMLKTFFSKTVQNIISSSELISDINITQY